MIILSAFASWLSSHEYIAVWAEGIALVAIFIWDRLDSRAQHRQTMDQLRIAQEQAATSHASAQSVINAERAWVMADLDWWTGSSHVAELTSQNAEGRTESTVARLRVICKNEGKSPAWIDNVYGQMEILRSALGHEIPAQNEMQSFGPIGPLGAGKERPRAMNLTCSGHRGEGEFLSVYALVEYHDIFGMKRESHLGYVIYDDNVIRQEGLPERNRNT